MVYANTYEIHLNLQLTTLQSYYTFYAYLHPFITLPLITTLVDQQLQQQPPSVSHVSRTSLQDLTIINELRNGLDRKKNVLVTTRKTDYFGTSELIKEEL